VGLLSNGRRAAFHHPSMVSSRSTLTLSAACQNQMIVAHQEAACDLACFKCRHHAPAIGGFGTSVWAQADSLAVETYSRYELVTQTRYHDGLPPRAYGAFALACWHLR